MFKKYITILVLAFNVLCSENSKTIYKVKSFLLYSFPKR